MSNGKTFRMLAINPGSTSTKIALFENEKKLFGTEVVHDAAELRKCAEIADQFPLRRDTVVRAMADAGYRLDGVRSGSIDAFVGRGGGCVACAGGTYSVNDLMLSDAGSGRYAKHPANFGSILASEFAREFGGKAFVVDPPSVDEMDDVARVTGIAGVYRHSRFHALNQKEAAIRAAAELGKSYADVNVVVAHVGGGSSVSAHRRGRVVDTTDLVDGEGPMAPTRCGNVPPGAVSGLCFSGEYAPSDISNLIFKNGGMENLLGTSDVREAKRMAEAGDEYAKLVQEAMAYQVGKYVGMFAAALRGDVDAVVLTGGVVRDTEFTEMVRSMVGFIAPVKVYGGEFEMEALANGALRVLRGEEKPQVYTGIPVWTDFKHLRRVTK